MCVLVYIFIFSYYICMCVYAYVSTHVYIPSYQKFVFYIFKHMNIFIHVFLQNDTMGTQASTSRINQFGYPPSFPLREIFFCIYIHMHFLSVLNMLNTGTMVYLSAPFLSWVYHRYYGYTNIYLLNQSLRTKLLDHFFFDVYTSQLGIRPTKSPISPQKSLISPPKSSISSQKSRRSPQKSPTSSQNNPMSVPSKTP